MKQNATGMFRLERINGRHCLVTPEGHGFLSLGVTHISAIAQEGDVDLFGETYNRDWTKVSEAALANSICVTRLRSHTYLATTDASTLIASLSTLAFSNKACCARMDRRMRHWSNTSAKPTPTPSAPSQARLSHSRGHNGQEWRRDSHQDDSSGLRMRPVPMPAARRWR